MAGGGDDGGGGGAGGLHCGSDAGGLHCGGAPCVGAPLIQDCRTMSPLMLLGYDDSLFFTKIVVLYLLHV